LATSSLVRVRVRVRVRIRLRLRLRARVRARDRVRSACGAPLLLLLELDLHEIDVRACLHKLLEADDDRRRQLVDRRVLGGVGRLVILQEGEVALRRHVHVPPVSVEVVGGRVGDGLVG